MLQFDKHTALLCGTETNLFETNRQNVTVQMQNHDGNRLARSNFATATRISFWKDVLALLSQRILGVSEIGPFSKNSEVWFGLVGGYGQSITFRQHALQPKFYLSLRFECFAFFLLFQN